MTVQSDVTARSDVTAPGEMAFGAIDAQWTDLLTRRKPYQAEVDQLHDIFTRYGPVTSVADLGCGTGRHLELLAAAGYEVVGVDRSPDMVRVARERAARCPGNAQVIEADLLEMELGRTFDAATMLTALFSYQTTNAMALAALRAGHRHLRPGGLLVVELEAMGALNAPAYADVWTVTDGDRQLLLAYSARRPGSEPVIEVTLRYWSFEGDRLAGREESVVQERVFLTQEMELLLDVAGFDVVGWAPLAGEEEDEDGTRLVWARRR